MRTARAVLLVGLVFSACNGALWSGDPGMSANKDGWSLATYEK